ncbi:MAG TPA: DUF362 domain-containing protein [Phycisphaerae bacterium]|nr:DUF362 domain-containing protein [Phycisphaerae bacterium]
MKHKNHCRPCRGGATEPCTSPVPGKGVGGRLGRAWQWFWFVFTKNRFAIAAASLIWLVWRSGSQPRRLAYPCQQAAAANLGFLAVLFVPALARHRRRRYGSSWPQAAELATGSVLLAGVLFILVSAGVEVYSNLTAAYAPGNPAVISWPQVAPTQQTALSPTLLAPSAAEAVVAVNRNPAVTYGTQPYGPGTNQAYDLVWQTVADLQLGPYDNPLQNFVADMDGDGTIEVLIKPNHVEYYENNSAGDRSPVYTHPALIRPLVDMLARAGAQQIRVGDGSNNTGTYFTAMMDRMGYTEAYFDQLRAAWPGVDIARVDLNNPKRWSWVQLGTQAGGASAYVGSGYTSLQLQKARDGSAAAYFSAKDSHGRNGPGASNCMGTLALSDAVLDADVVIDLAKLKVHYLGVNTAALKNWVGITMFSTYNMAQINGCRVAHNVYGATNYEMQFGNDILWRELVDAHRAVLYYDGQAIRTTPQRRVLCILDAINCGERYHVPNKPWHVWLDTVLASVDPVAIDAVASRLQRYDFRRIPIVNNAHAASINSNWPVGTADPGNVRIVGSTDIDQTTYSRLFAWETAQDPNMMWPDWSQTAIQDLQAPVIHSWSRTGQGDTWQLNATIEGCHVAYFSYGEATGTTQVVRLARSGDLFTAVLPGAIADGWLVAQDAQFNTRRLLLTERPIIELNKHELTPSGLCMLPVAGDTLTVRNAGTGVLNYTIDVQSDPSNWITVTPSTGSSSGEPVTITVAYSHTGLIPGTYTATITVSDPASYNLRETVTVRFTLTGFDVDFDNDGDVDQEDYARMQTCLTGEWMPQNDPACAGARMDGDSDVDTSDILLFQQCMSSPGELAGPCCAP